MSHWCPAGFAAGFVTKAKTMAVGQLLLDADDFVTAIPAAKRLKLLNYVAAAVVGVTMLTARRRTGVTAEALVPFLFGAAGQSMMTSAPTPSNWTTRIDFALALVVSPSSWSRRAERGKCTQKGPLRASSAGVAPGGGARSTAGNSTQTSATGLSTMT